MPDLRTLTLVTCLTAALTGTVAVADTTVDAVGSDLTLVHLSGSRDLTVSSVSGGDFTAVDFGTVRTAPFLANVTDLLYDNTAYELNASMSNLYPLPVGSPTPDCGATSIDAALVSVDFPTLDALALVDLRVLVEPVFTLTGPIGGAVAALDLTGALTPSTQLVVTVTGQLLETAQNEVVDVIIDDLEAAVASLPLAIANGAGGAFAQALPHPVCGGGAALPTAVGIQSGDPNAAFDLDDLLADIFGALDGGDGVLSAADLVTAGIFDEAVVDGAIAAALAQLLDSVGVAPAAAIVQGLIADVRGGLDATLAELPGLDRVLAQSGSYNTVAELVIADLTTVVPALPAGRYGGRLEFTLIDKEAP